MTDQRAEDVRPARRGGSLAPNASLPEEPEGAGGEGMSSDSLSWLYAEWSALALDLDQQADRLERFVGSLRERAVYARQKAKEANGEQ